MCVCRNVVVYMCTQFRASKREIHTVKENIHIFFHRISAMCLGEEGRDPGSVAGMCVLYKGELYVCVCVCVRIHIYTQLTHRDLSLLAKRHICVCVCNPFPPSRN